MPPNPPPVKISITNQQELYAPNFSRLREAGKIVLEGERIKKAKINLVLMTDIAIHDINRRFLQHDEPTDVITFPMSNPGAATLEAEILVSTDTAQTVSSERGHEIESEILLYFVHGLLHLCGYDDHAAKERKRMRDREQHYLQQLEVTLKGSSDW